MDRHEAQAPGDGDTNHPLGPRSANDTPRTSCIKENLEKASCTRRRPARL
jgi:hypothetical protein